MTSPAGAAGRRGSLVSAAIDEIGAQGSLNVTVGAIARRAGVSSALAHHYFGTKQAILLSAMRQILSTLGAEYRLALDGAETPAERLDAILRASFAPSNYRAETVKAWLAFYGAARSSEWVARLLAVYHARLRSNLLHALRPLVGARAEIVAEGMGALIDGIYIRQASRPGPADPGAALALARSHLARLTETS